MKIIKNSEELKALLNEYDDLIINEDVRIEYQVKRGELRDVQCYNLYLENDSQKFDFNGRDFSGHNFNGHDFNGDDFNGNDFYGQDFNGYDFNGHNFYGHDFNGYNFTGRKVSYYAFFNCYGSMTCESYEGRRTPHAEPVTFNGKITIIKPQDDEVEKAIQLLKEKGRLVDGKILN